MIIHIVGALIVLGYVSYSIGILGALMFNRIVYRKVTLNLAIALWITGCGHDDSSSSSADKAPPSEKNEALESHPSAPSGELPEVKTGTESLETTALLVETKETAPACGEKNLRQLIYVKETGIFESCTAEGWAIISIKTEKGERGTQGIQGERGEKGAQGERGADAPYIGPDEWLDPLTKKVWFLGQSYTVSQVPSLDTLCSAPGHSPSQEQIKEAGKNGLYERFRSASGNKKYWVGHGPYTTYGVTYEHQGLIIELSATPYILDGVMESLSPVGHPAPTTTYHRTLCVKN